MPWTLRNAVSAYAIKRYRDRLNAIYWWYLAGHFVVYYEFSNTTHHESTVLTITGPGLRYSELSNLPTRSGLRGSRLWYPRHAGVVAFSPLIFNVHINSWWAIYVCMAWTLKLSFTVEFRHMRLQDLRDLVVWGPSLHRIWVCIRCHFIIILLS